MAHLTWLLFAWLCYCFWFWFWFWLHRLSLLSRRMHLARQSNLNAHTRRHGQCKESGGDSIGGGVCLCRPLQVKSCKSWKRPCKSLAIGHRLKVGPGLRGSHRDWRLIPFHLFNQPAFVADPSLFLFLNVGPITRRGRVIAIE